MKTTLLGCLLVLAGSQALAQPSQLAGTIQGLGAKPLIFWYTQKGVSRADTVRTTNGRFSYAVPATDDGQVSLLISGPHFTHFWVEPGRLTVTGSAARPHQLTITGTPENDVLNAYNQTINWKYERLRAARPAARAQLNEAERVVTLAFIKQHPGTLTAAELLYWQSVRYDKQLPAYEALYQQLTPAVQKSFQGQRVAKRLLKIRNQPVLGRPAPAFSIADTAGRPVALSAYRGRYVLLDFWGHWCGPCMKAAPQVKAIQEKYARSLTVIGIAIEGVGDTLKWKRAIRAERMSWVQLSERRGTDGPVTEDYNITAYPTYLLLDRQGIILARANDVEAIEKKLLALADL